MDIILDTNILRSDWHLKSKEIDVLKDYLSKTDSRFKLPKIILEEIEGLHKRTLQEEINNYSKANDKLHQILNKRFGEAEIDIDFEAGNYINALKTKLNISENDIIDYDNNYLPEIVKRAINREKPFKDDGKGFRDCIIWLTILNYAQNCHENQIIFISNNPKDFGDDEKSNPTSPISPTKLHKDLKEECDNLGVKINYFRTIKEFIELHSKLIDLYDYDWVAENLDFKALSNAICDKMNDSSYFQFTNWFEDKTGKESNDDFRVLDAETYNSDGLFIYEMVDGSLIINVTMEAQLEVEFGYYEYDIGYDFRDSNTDVEYMNAVVSISLVYQDEEITEIEIGDFTLI